MNCFTNDLTIKCTLKYICQLRLGMAVLPELGAFILGTTHRHNSPAQLAVNNSFYNLRVETNTLVVIFVINSTAQFYSLKIPFGYVKYLLLTSNCLRNR